ncbi:MAG: hypothetical protein JW810_03790 [Sedimentisphaerales bacterium]|nr:hypothetical protein [Sedimentisphaerales bacterium]
MSWRPLPVVLEVDGQPAPFLELREITRRAGAKGIEARFRLWPDLQGSLARFEDIAEALSPGERVTVRMPCPDTSVADSKVLWPLFEGVICRGEAAMANSAEGVEIIACNPLQYLNTQAIDRVRVAAGDGETVEIPTTPVVFNADGRPNASAIEVEIEGTRTAVFEMNESRAIYWTYARAIHYIAAAWLPRDAAQSALAAGLENLTAGQVLRDVEVTGLRPLEAIERLCQQAGLEFCIRQVPAGEADVADVLHFCRRGQGRKVYLRHQKSQETLDPAKTNLAGCTVKTDRPGQTLRLIGRGAPKRFEGTFALVGGWDPNLEENNYDLYSPLTNPDFRTVRNVFRKWVLNEAGDYRIAPFCRGPAYDFSAVFGNQQYAARRRRFYPCLSTNAAGEGFGYFLEVSYDGGQTWQEYAGTFDNLLDECGVYLGGVQLDAMLWYAIKKDELRFRITAVVEADACLQAEIGDGPVDAARPVRTMVFDRASEFAYWRVTASSVFHAGAAGALGTADERDDRESLRGWLRDRLLQERQEEWAGTASLAWIAPAVWPGDVVTGVQGRELEFGSLADGRSVGPQVRQVQMVWGDTWSTEIRFGS